VQVIREVCEVEAAEVVACVEAVHNMQHGVGEVERLMNRSDTLLQVRVLREHSPKMPFYRSLLCTCHLADASNCWPASTRV
jgi:hypothetical protein